METPYVVTWCFHKQKYYFASTKLTPQTGYEKLFRTLCKFQIKRLGSVISLVSPNVSCNILYKNSIKSNVTVPSRSLIKPIYIPGNALDMATLRASPIWPNTIKIILAVSMPIKSKTY